MNHTHKNTVLNFSFYLSLCCFIFFTLSACSHRLSEEPIQVDYGSAPSLSGLQASANPAQSGSVIQLRTQYVDPDSDFHTGIAAISIDGGEPESIAFRATYPSGLLTLPFSISPLRRPSDLHLSLKVRDDAGNWSNAVSMTLQIREPADDSPATPLPSTETFGL